MEVGMMSRIEECHLVTMLKYAALRNRRQVVESV